MSGTSGAPSPPAATSRTRKSLTTGRPVRSAITAASPICSVAPRAPGGARVVHGGLAVRADQVDVAIATPAVAQTAVGRLGEGLAEEHVEIAQRGRVGLRDPDNPLVQRAGERRGHEGPHLQVRGLAVPGDGAESGVGAVGAGVRTAGRSPAGSACRGWPPAEARDRATETSITDGAGVPCPAANGLSGSIPLLLKRLTPPRPRTPPRGR